MRIFFLKQVRECKFRLIYKNSNHIKVLFLFVIIQISILLIFFTAASSLTSLFDANFFLKGTNDSAQFYNIGVSLYQEMLKSGGLGIFEIRPEGQLPAGVNALIFWFFKNNDSWRIIVFASILHVLTVFLYYKIFVIFFNSKNSILSAIILQINPISASWFLQHHKESYTSLSFALITYVVLKKERKVLDYLLIIISIIIFAYTKHYLVVIISSYAIFLNFIKISKVESLKNKIFEQLSFFALIAACLILSQKISGSNSVASLPKAVSSLESRVPVSSSICSNIINKINTTRLWFYESHEGNTTFDRDYIFKNCFDLIRYVPKATYISFFSPSPLHINFSDNNLRSKIELIVSALWMMLSAFFTLNLFFSKNKVLIYIFILIAPLMLLFTYLIPNIGTIARYRSPYYSVIIGLGCCYFLSWRASLKRND